MAFGGWHPLDSHDTMLHQPEIKVNLWEFLRLPTCQLRFLMWLHLDVPLEVSTVDF